MELSLPSSHQIRSALPARLLIRNSTRTVCKTTAVRRLPAPCYPAAPPSTKVSPPAPMSTDAVTPGSICLTSRMLLVETAATSALSSFRVLHPPPHPAQRRLRHPPQRRLRHPPQRRQLHLRHRPPWLTF